MTAGRKCALLLITAGTTLLLATSYAPGRSPQRVVLDEGKIGRSVWTAWLRPAAQPGRARGRVCRGIALAGPSPGGLWAQSEFEECSAVSATAPVIESIDRGERRKQRTVWLALLSPEVSKVYFRIGHTPRGKVVTPQRLSPREAKALGTDQLEFWVHGYAGNPCLHRLITYDSSGETLSDSGKESC
jgi:hypothetical protein